MQITYLLRQFCEDATYLHGYTRDTIERYKSQIGLFSRMTQLVEIADATEEIVRKFFFEGRSQRKWSVNTYITYHKSLKVFFRWCVKHQLLKSNPTDGLEKPKLVKKTPPKLTREEAHRLLEFIDNYPWHNAFLRHRNHAIFATFIFAGLRKKELLKLKFTDVNLENQTLFVQEGKGRKDRYIPISRPLAERLGRYLTERTRLKKTCPEFFTSLPNNAALSESSFKRLLDVAKRTLHKKFSAHKLRHTFATLMLEGGCDIYSLSTMMGHSDIKTTAIYLTATAEHLRGQIMKHPLNDSSLLRSSSDGLELMPTPGPV